jgi:hypothetical protein
MSPRCLKRSRRRWERCGKKVGGWWAWLFSVADRGERRLRPFGPHPGPSPLHSLVPTSASAGAADRIQPEPDPCLVTCQLSQNLQVGWQADLRCSWEKARLKPRGEKQLSANA